MVRSAADTTLEILKDDDLKDLDKKKEIEEILGPLSSETFGQLTTSAKRSRLRRARSAEWRPNGDAKRASSTRKRRSRALR